jgi:dinuclear metal center YbgI/SA1388 family protein
MTCRIGEIVAIMEELAPPSYAQEWDNIGLQLGSPSTEISAVLVSIDATVEVLAEAREKGASLLICHHPPLFRPLHRLLSDDPVGSILHEAILTGIAIYAAHTNLDASPIGVNAVLAEIFGLEDDEPLERLPGGEVFKLVTFLPAEHLASVSAALFESGAGVIGDYTGCSFRVEGIGSFRPVAGAHPAYGEPGKQNEVPEVRLEVVVEEHVLKNTTNALLAAHPYEEPAYDVYPLIMSGSAGMGRVGNLPRSMSLGELVRECSNKLGNRAVRFTGDSGRVISRVALCSGSGAKLADKAMQAGAQALITGDVGYHESMNAAAMGLAIIDAGHYHTERPVVERLVSLLKEKAQEAGLEVEVNASGLDTSPWSEGGTD